MSSLELRNDCSCHHVENAWRMMWVGRRVKNGETFYGKLQENKGKRER